MVFIRLVVADFRKDVIPAVTVAGLNVHVIPAGLVGKGMGSMPVEAIVLGFIFLYHLP